MSGLGKKTFYSNFVPAKGRTILHMIKIHLSRILGEKRINQAELSRKTGIHPATINEIYHELCARINLEHLEKICEALDCDVPDILERIAPKK